MADQEQQQTEEQVSVSTFEDSFNEAASETVAVETPVKVDEKPLEVPQTEVKPLEEKQVETQSEVDYKTELANERQRTKSWEGRLSKAEAQNRELQNKLLELEQQRVTPKDIPTGNLVDVDNPLIKSFVDEMGDDFIKPLNAYIKTLISEAIKPFSEKVPVIEQQVTSFNETKVKDHYSAITEAHSDVEQILASGELDLYVDSLPYKDAVVKKQIMQGGSTAQVISLLTEFKEKTGKVKQTESEQPAVVVQKVPKVKVDAATVVKGGTYTIPKGKASADDFAGAFNEAINTNQ